MQSMNYLFNHLLLPDIINKDNPNKYFKVENISETINTMWDRMHTKYHVEKKGNLVVSLEDLKDLGTLTIIKFPEGEATPDSLYVAFILNSKENVSPYFTYEMSPGFDFNKEEIRETQHYSLCIWENGKRNVINVYNTSNLDRVSKLIKENL